jgi:hypothetical protein
VLSGGLAVRLGRRHSFYNSFLRMRNTTATHVAMADTQEKTLADEFGSGA